MKVGLLSSHRGTPPYDVHEGTKREVNRLTILANLCVTGSGCCVYIHIVRHSSLSNYYKVAIEINHLTTANLWREMKCKQQHHI